MKMFKYIKLLIIGVVIFLGAPINQTAKAATNDKPTTSVTDNKRADSLGIFADNDAGIASCWQKLKVGNVRFYEPTDTHNYDPKAKTAPLEKDGCWRMRVRGGSIGVVALREGALVNLGQRNGREQPVAYEKCNNWIEATVDPVNTQTLKIKAAPTVTRSTRTEEHIVTVRRIIRHIYVNVIEGEKPPPVNVEIPPTVYQYVHVPLQTQEQCICLDNPDNETMFEIRVTKKWKGLIPGLYCMPEQLALSYYQVKHWD